MTEFNDLVAQAYKNAAHEKDKIPSLNDICSFVHVLNPNTEFSLKQLIHTLKTERYSYEHNGEYKHLPVQDVW